MTGVCLLVAALAFLVGVPSFIAGWLCGGFRELQCRRFHA